MDRLFTTIKKEGQIIGDVIKSFLVVSSRLIIINKHK